MPGPEDYGADVLWRQRIRKEEAVNAKVNPEGFSVRSAVRSRDVPMRFKPLHVDPREAKSLAVSFDPSSSTAKELQQVLSARNAAPRQRLLWPESTQHDMGWLVPAPEHSDFPPNERSTLTGQVPRVGFGWVDSSGSIERRLRVAEDHQLRRPFGPPDLTSASLVDNATAPASSGSYSTHGTSKEASRNRRMHGEQTLQTPRNADGSLAQIPGKARARTAEDGSLVQTSGKARVRTAEALEAYFSLPQPSPASPAKPAPCSPKSLSGAASSADPWAVATCSDATLIRPSPSQEQAVAAATKQTYTFLNGSGNRWYRPNHASDVVDFSDTYMRSWGVSMFYRKHAN